MHTNAQHPTALFKIIIIVVWPGLGFRVGELGADASVGWLFVVIYHSSTATDSPVLQCAINEAAMLKHVSQFWMVICG